MVGQGGLDKLFQSKGDDTKQCLFCPLRHSSYIYVALLINVATLIKGVPSLNPAQNLTNCNSMPKINNGKANTNIWLAHCTAIKALTIGPAWLIERFQS